MRKSLNNIIYGGIATEAMNTFASGPLLIAYALLFNAGHIAVGFLGSVEFIGWFSHLLAAYLIDKGKSPKYLSIRFSAVSRIFYLVAALLAFYHQYPWALLILIISISSTFLIGGVAGGSFYPWMKALIPARTMGRFFAQRYKWMTVASMICYGISAGIIFLFEHAFPNQTIFAYSLLLTFAFCAGGYGVYTFFQVQDVKIERSQTEIFVKKAIHTFKDTTFKKLCFLMSLVNFGISFLTPFLTVFMLKKIGVSMPTVVLFTLISQITFIISTKYQSHTIDKRGCSGILRRGSLFYLGTIILFATSAYTPLKLSLALLIFAHILLGIGRFSINLGRNNMPLIVVPKRNSSVYLSIISIIKASSSSVAGITAGFSLTLLERLSPSYQMAWTLFWGICSLLICLIFYITTKIRKDLAC